jgi:hypothetical protein
MSENKTVINSIEQQVGIEFCRCNIVARKIYNVMLQMYLNVINTRSSNTVRGQVLSHENYSQL